DVLPSFICGQLAQAPPDETAGDGQAELRQLRHRALLEFRELFDKQVWEAFWRVVVLEHAPADVAAELGLSVWAFYRSKSRVLQRLRLELDRLVDWGKAD